MAELEQEEVIETPEEEVIDNEETVEEEVVEENFDDEELKLFKRFGINPENATIDDLKNIMKRAYKAEKVVVEKKAKEKTTPKETPVKQSEDVRAILAEEKFYDKNPDAESYRKEIEGYFKKGITRDEALVLVSRKDKEIEKTREVYGKPLIGKSNNEGIAVVSVEAFDKMTPQTQEEYTKKMTSQYGKIKFKY